MMCTRRSRVFGWALAVAAIMAAASVFNMAAACETASHQETVLQHETHLAAAVYTAELRADEPLAVHRAGEGCGCCQAMCGACTIACANAGAVVAGEFSLGRPAAPAVPVEAVLSAFGIVPDPDPHPPKSFTAPIVAA